MQDIPPLNGSQSVRVNYFIRIKTPANGQSPAEELAFSDYPGPNISFDGSIFTSLSTLTAVGEVKRDIQTTSHDVLVSVAGVQPSFVVKVLNDFYRGSSIEIFEGFSDANSDIIGNTLYRKYLGKITGYTPREIFDNDSNSQILTVTFSSASAREVLASEFSGRFTNASSNKYYFPNDTTFDRVQTLQNINLPYGRAN